MGNSLNVDIATIVSDHAARYKDRDILHGRCGKFVPILSYNLDKYILSVIFAESTV